MKFHQKNNFTKCEINNEKLNNFYVKILYVNLEKLLYNIVDKKGKTKKKKEIIEENFEHDDVQNEEKNLKKNNFNLIIVIIIVCLLIILFYIRKKIKLKKENTNKIEIKFFNYYF